MIKYENFQHSSHIKLAKFILSKFSKHKTPAKSDQHAHKSEK